MGKKLEIHNQNLISEKKNLEEGVSCHQTPHKSLGMHNLNLISLMDLSVLRNYNQNVFPRHNA
jgi:hypothetical protein